MLQPTVFISYKRDDDATGKALARLEPMLAEMRLSIFRDERIRAGEVWSNELYNELMGCSAAIALIGKAASGSEWCRREWWLLAERNRTEGLPVIPVSVDGTTESAGILDHLLSELVPIEDLTPDHLQDWPGLEALRPSPQAWLGAHHAWLRWQYRGARMWGREPFSLDDVYVRTECGRLDWGGIDRDDRSVDPFSEDQGGRHDLIATALELVLDPAVREPIVVQGAPGAGKSAFTLRIADELLDHGFQPVLVRFRDFRLAQFQRADELIEDALRIGPAADAPPGPPIGETITEDLMNRTAEAGGGRVSQVVFILDGWDEVSLTGSTGYQAQLTTWLPKLRAFANERPGPPVRLILTGRPSAEVKDSGILKRVTPVLTVRPMQPPALVDYATRMAGRLATEADRPDPWAIDLDRLKPLFESYAEWFQDPDAEGRRSLEVLGSPLLAFLALRTLSEWEGDPASLVGEPTALYKVLIDTTVEHGGQGRDRGLEGTIHQRGAPLRFLLHRVAGVISILGKESVSFHELSLRLADDSEFARLFGRRSLGQAVDEEDRLNTLLGLVVSFFFKGGNEELGCEFLHKSFREYLFAESIVALLRRLSEGQGGGLQAPAVEYWQDFDPGSLHHEATRALSTLLAPQWLTGDVKGHLFALIRDDIAAEPDRWLWLRDLILDVYIWWAEGVHLRPQRVRGRRGAEDWAPGYMEEIQREALPYDMDAPANPPRSAALDAALGEALMELCALVHAELLDHSAQADPANSLRQYYRADPGNARFAPGGEGHFKTLVARINASGWRPLGTFPEQARLARVSLTIETTPFVEFYHAELGGAELGGAELGGANCRRAQTMDCRLQFADLSEVIELTQDQVNVAQGNSATWLPPDLTHPDHWEKVDGDVARD